MSGRALSYKLYTGRGARLQPLSRQNLAHSPDQRGRAYLGHGRVTRPEGELVVLYKDGPELAPEGQRHIAAVRHRSGQPTVRDLSDAGTARTSLLMVIPMERGRTSMQSLRKWPPPLLGGR